MKNYELISELMKLPAGHEIVFEKTVRKEEFKNENVICASGTVEDIVVSDTDEEICLIC